MMVSELITRRDTARPKRILVVFFLFFFFLGNVSLIRFSKEHTKEDWTHKGQ